MHVVLCFGGEASDFFVLDDGFTGLGIDDEREDGGAMTAKISLLVASQQGARKRSK